jgi:hypothetical protein
MGSNASDELDSYTQTLNYGVRSIYMDQVNCGQRVEAGACPIASGTLSHGIAR